MPTYTAVSEHFTELIRTLIDRDDPISDPVSQEELLDMYLTIGALLKWKFGSGYSVIHAEFGSLPKQ